MANSPILVQNVPQVGRKGRNPQHTFQVESMPWQIQPFMIAPVLPGDSLKNLLLQVRAVSDPIKNPLIGWWLEHYVFYVPHRAMAGSEQYQAMMLDPTATAGNVEPVAWGEFYRYAGSVDWMPQLLDAVVKQFFRDQDEVDWSTKKLGELFLAQVNKNSWMDSIQPAAAFDAANAVPDFNVDGPDANTTIQASEVDLAMRQWSMLRDMRLTDATYEDYLRTYGVRIKDQETEILPELVRYSREWTYPTNTVDPATGNPSSACSWSIAERADKARFFKEPGFLLGVTTSRPKVYFAKQTGAAAGLLDNVFAWLPAVLGNDPYASLKRVLAGTGPIPNQTDAYIVDLKDLYLYGDQFLSMPLTEADNGLVQLPTAGLNKKYVSQGDVDGLFSTSNKRVRQDGVCSLNILSRVVDTTATT